VDEYERMAEAGVLPEEENIELLDGRIYRMSPIGSAHAACVDRLNRLFVRGVGEGAIVRIQSPIVLPPTSEPEPDVALLKPRPDGYTERHPRPKEVVLVVEVADTSLDFDRETKGPLYARAGVPEYWIIALDDKQVHVFRGPEGERFGTHETSGPGDELAVAELPALSPVPVEHILGE
jgi:Uma2 family endonuclease